MIGRPTLLFLAALPCASILCAQDQDPILARIPKDTTNLLVIRDPLPHVEALLQTPELEEVARATADLQQEVFGMKVSPGLLQKQMQLFVPFVPREIVVAAPPQAMVAFGHLCSSMLAGFLASTSSAGDVEVAELRAVAQKHLVQLQLPNFMASVRARDERTAELWFETVGDAFAEVADDGFVLTGADDVLTVVLHPSKINGGKMLEQLRSIELDPAPLEGLSTTFTVTLAGDRITLQVGPQGPVGLTKDALHELWRAGDEQLLFTTLHVEEALPMWNESLGLLEAAMETTHDIVMPQVVPISSMLTRLADLSPTVTSSMVMDNGIEWVLVETFDEDETIEWAAPPKALLQCLDPNAGGLMLANVPFDLLLAGMFEGVLEEIGTRARRPEFVELYQWLSDKTESLREFLGGESSAVFTSGVALVTSETTLKGLSYGDTAMRDLPFFAWAAVAAADDAESATGFCTHIGELLAEAMDSEIEAPWLETDLGFGLPTRVLLWRLMLPDGVRFEVTEGFVPHHVQKGDLMIVSTDPALTRTLLARMDGPVEVDKPDEGVLAWSQLSGTQMASMTRMLGQWVLEIQKHAPEELRFAAEIDGVMQVVAAALQNVDRYEQKLTISNTEMRDTTRLLLKPAGEREAMRARAQKAPEQKGK